MYVCKRYDYHNDEVLCLRNLQDSLAVLEAILVGEEDKEAKHSTVQRTS